MLMLMLLDDTSPRFGGSPDPDGERHRRWQPASRKVMVPTIGSFSCLLMSGASAPTDPGLAYGFTLAAIGFCAVAARAALRERSQD